MPPSCAAACSCSRSGSQEAVLAVIRSSLAERGHGPTVREIGARAGLSITSSVAHQLGRLEARGLTVRAGRDWSTCVRADSAPGGG
ncbi:LexA family protein [Streptomyces sp. NPDC055886]